MRSCVGEHPRTNRKCPTPWRRKQKQPETACRTTAIEVSTQSAGLSSGMAAKFFSPEAALPGAVAAVIHNVTGAIYASIVRRKPLN